MPWFVYGDLLTFTQDDEGDLPTCQVVQGVYKRRERQRGHETAHSRAFAKGEDPDSVVV